MAGVKTIAKANAYAAALGQAFGVEPDIEYGQDYARVYYSRDKLSTVQQNIRSAANAGPGDVRLDLVAPMAPAVLEKSWPYLLGIAFLGYMIGKKF